MEVALMSNKTENTFMSLETGEVVTITETDGLYVKLSNNITLTSEAFLKQYKLI
jgi:hypothetical protein